MKVDSSTNQRCCVLLATYNGETYLEEQLASLVAQTRRADKIFIRDDGSKDSTREIIKTWAERHPEIVVVDDGEHLGAASSFFALLEAASDAFDIYFFCDQDDVWLPFKIERALASFERADAHTPFLYFSRLKIVDASLGELALSPLAPTLGFGNALVQNVVTGCSSAINNAAREKIIGAKPLQRQIYMHDWWCYLVVSAFGVVHYDDKPTILYRQHASNVVGAASSELGALERRIKNAASPKWMASRPSATAQKFLDAYRNDLEPRVLSLLEVFVGGKTRVTSRLALCASRQLWRQTLKESLILRATLLLNLY